MMKSGLSRLYTALYQSRRRVLLVNLVSGTLIAVSVYYFGQSAFPDTLINGVVRDLLLVKEFIARRRALGISPTLLMIAHAGAIFVAAGVCSYFRSLRTIVAVNGGLILGILALNLSGLAGHSLPLSSAVIVFLITVGASLDYYYEQKFHRRLCRNIADKQQAEHAILRHMGHSINPTVQMALSPLRSVIEFLKERGRQDEVLARRRDGSEETVGAALETAVVSLNQIREIIETTEDIFGNRITPRDFTEVSLSDVFTSEIMPLFPGAKFSLRLEAGAVGKVRLHRPSFVQAIKNIVRNAEVHGFPDGFSCNGEPYVLFIARETVKEIVIDCENNGVPFPRGVKTKDFLTYGVKGKQSPGKGLGGAWVQKFVEAHGGRFRKISSNPVRFRITLPKRRA
jgi:hypothetical protein